jgi:NAD(P)H-nitrite reductase large subunit
LGTALGPDWASDLAMKGRLAPGKDVTLEHECQLIRVYSSQDVPPDKKRQQTQVNNLSYDDWPAFAELSNGKVYGCDFIVSATGVTPSVEPFMEGNNLDISEDGGLKVNKEMLTSEPDVYAAGDITWPDWEWAETWFPMRLWTQARQTGTFAGLSISCHLQEKDPSFYFNFELFTHVTQFFGYKVILIGLFNGQKLDNNYEVLLRVTDGEEYIKVILKNGRMKGALLVGETDLEETFENLILNQLDLSRYGEDLLHPSVDIEDYFD